MKKIVALVLFVANITCFGMNTRQRQTELLERLVKAQEHQAKMQELNALSPVAIECAKLSATNPFNQRKNDVYLPIWYGELNCNQVLTRYHQLLKENSNQL